MKPALPYNILLALIMLPVFALASTPDIGKYTKKKVINKEFNVSADAMLKVNNSYGNIDIVTWNENRVVFEITITTTGNDEEKVQEKLDGIDVTFEASSSNVSARTKFNESKSWWNWKGKNKVKMKINYVIKAPITNSVNLNNDYGNINLASLKGQAFINCDYGKITTKELFADNNSITFDYSNNCYFEFIKSGKINADYSGFTVAKANVLDINADYTKSTIEVAEDVNYNCDYGNIKIEKANNVVGNGDYLTALFGDIYKNMELTADYGSIKIDRINESGGNIMIDSDYVHIKLGYAPGYNFNFDFNLSYGSLKGDDNLEFSNKEVKSTNKKYRGYHGNSTSGNLIKIKSSYGGVSLNKN